MDPWIHSSAEGANVCLQRTGFNPLHLIFSPTDVGTIEEDVEEHKHEQRRNKLRKADPWGPCANVCIFLSFILRCLFTIFYIMKGTRVWVVDVCADEELKSDVKPYDVLMRKVGDKSYCIREAIVSKVDGMKILESHTSFGNSHFCSL
jgi:hypothetical protein